MTDEQQQRIFSKNLRHYVERTGKPQKEVAKELGVNQKTFNGWLNLISTPKAGTIQKLADYFEIGKSDLLDDKSSISATQPPKGIVINVFGKVSAGIPIEMIEDIVDQEEITEDMALKGTYFGIKIKGDSMIPNICDGDTVIVRWQDDAENGETVIATVNGSDATCKRLRKHKDGIELIANNPNYEPMYYSNDEIENKPVRILGKVVELRRKF